jgi:glutamine amidotransferase
MMGLATRNRVSPLWFEDFQRLAVDGKLKHLKKDGCHDAGWGIAGYLGTWTVHFGRSEKGAAADRQNFMSACNKAITANSKIIMAHLRQASDGDRLLENLHPFIHNDWIFCHNGTIQDPERLLVPGCEYAGSSDSERFFRFLIHRLERRSVKDYPELLRAAIEDVKERCAYTSLTFLLSNGNYLVGYRDCAKNDDRYTLYYSPGDNMAFMFCSEEIPGFEWTAMQNGELLVVDKIGGFLNEF